MPFGAEPLVLTEEERQELQQMTQSRTLPAGDVMRSRMVLLLADGVAYQKIQDLLDTTAPTIARWKNRFRQHCIAGLMEELHPTGAACVLEASHSCMTIRGVRKPDAIMVTSALRGIFKENPSSRSEILTLMYSEKNGKV